MSISLKGALADVGHLGGELLQLAAGGGLVLFGLDPKYAVAAWGIGKVLSVLGVRGLNIPATPPVIKP